ncbi:hypothetical protein EIP91_000384 [Steccherinum ochraceum]|uniref:Uncharacterized protein n=1 Tax=Steccherinum ochraceum TaxID=92696 RepID=A0A4R0RTP8_9APHY|nr:hypothetical protein EIP91_000384 [Steccherinum ochraceum]
MSSSTLASFVYHSGEMSSFTAPPVAGILGSSVFILCVHPYYSAEAPVLQHVEAGNGFGLWKRIESSQLQSRLPRGPSYTHLLDIVDRTYVIPVRFIDLDFAGVASSLSCPHDSALKPLEEVS